MKKALLFVVSFLLIISLINASPIWPKFQNSLDNNGVVNFLGPINSELKCKTNPLNHYLSSSSPVVAQDGTIYIGTFTKKLYAINPDCSIKWFFEGDTNSAFLTPVIGDDNIIYASNGEKIYAINPDGSKKWEFKPELSFAFNFKSDLVLYQNILWVGGVYTTFAINSNDGSVKCKFTSEGSSSSSDSSVMSIPSIYNNNVYVADLNSVYKLDLNCNKIWKYDANRVYFRTPVVYNSKIYITRSEYPGKILVLNDQSQQDIVFDAGQVGTLTIKNDNIYAATESKKLYIFSLNGVKKCEFLANDKFEAAPIVDSDGNVFVGNNDKNFYAINNNCQLLWKYTVGGDIVRSAAFGLYNELIVPSKDKRLYIFKNNTYVPKLQQNNPNSPGSNCNNNIKDYDESDIDCGGAYCSSCSTPNNNQSTGSNKPEGTIVTSEDESCNSCLIIGKRTGNNFVDECEGGLRDVEGCYLAKYDCDTDNILEKRLCDKCKDARCDEDLQPGIDLNIGLDINIPEDNLIFDCEKYNCKGNIPDIDYGSVLTTCSDNDENDNYNVKGTIQADQVSVEDSCLTMTRSGNINFVDECEGGFRDVESCYLVQYSCKDNKIDSKRTLCNLCNNGVCNDTLVKKQSTGLFTKIISWFKNLFS